jgi:hypothetical protein
VISLIIFASASASGLRGPRPTLGYRQPPPGRAPRGPRARSSGAEGFNSAARTRRSSASCAFVHYAQASCRGAGAGPGNKASQRLRGLWLVAQTLGHDRCPQGQHWGTVRADGSWGVRFHRVSLCHRDPRIREDRDERAMPHKNGPPQPAASAHCRRVTILAIHTLTRDIRLASETVAFGRNSTYGSTGIDGRSSESRAANAAATGSDRPRRASRPQSISMHPFIGEPRRPSESAGDLQRYRMVAPLLYPSPTLDSLI